MVDPVHRTRRRRLALFAFALGITAAAITIVAVMLLSRGGPPPETPCTTCPPSSLRDEPACIKGVPNNSMPRNAMPHNSMPRNGLRADALAENRAFLDALQQTPLGAGAFLAVPPPPTAGGDWGGLLAKPYAADLAAYVVSCALDPCERVTIPGHPELVDEQKRYPDGFPGELGLCGKAYNDWARANSQAEETPWSTDKPTAGCLERVSACVLARVNAVAARIPISMRGDGTALLQRVDVQTQYRENFGTPIQSFQRCDRMCLWGDRLRRNCDWEPRYVGQCVRDDGAGNVRTVRLTLASSTPVRVRVCKGIYGCDDTATALGAGAATAPVFANGQLVEFPPYYGGQMIAQGIAGTSGGTIEFPCPDDGPLESTASSQRLRTGYYSVMLGTMDPGVQLTATADVTLVPGTPAGTPPFDKHDAYPAPEVHVFSYREGGFYGSLFTPLPPAAPDVCEPPSGDQFSCASEIWTVSGATFTARHCAGPLSPRGCFGTPPGLCDVAHDPTANPRSCDPVPSASGPKVYGACYSDGATARWQAPYTSYLNHPCDMFTSDDECRKHLVDPEEPAFRAPPKRNAMRSAQ